MDIATASLADLEWYKSYLLGELGRAQDHVSLWMAGVSFSEWSDLRDYQITRLAAVEARIAELTS